MPAPTRAEPIENVGLLKKNHDKTREPDRPDATDSLKDETLHTSTMGTVQDRARYSLCSPVMLTGDHARSSHGCNIAGYEEETTYYVMVATPPVPRSQGGHRKAAGVD